MASLEVVESSFGQVSANKGDIRRLDLKNDVMQVSLLNYGATILSVETPDKDGKLEEITLNYNTLPNLLHNTFYFGSTVGRVANRICNARFVLEGKEYKLAANNGPNHLHGGLVGFDRALWDAKVIQGDGYVGVKFTHTSPDGDEGYPGNVTVEATYTLTADNKLEMDFKAESDAPTPLALTNHAYWNLSGNFKAKVTEEQVLRVAASKYLVLGDHQIPTGELHSVTSTPFDLQEETRIGERVPEIDGGGKPGFDHCFAVDGYQAVTASDRDEEVRSKARFMASLKDLASGRAMDVFGTQPGIQVYTANWLSEDAADAPLIQHNAVCLETEFYPNAINDSSLGVDIVCRPGQTYRHYTVHHFYTK